MVFRHVLLAASFFGTAGNELGQQILASSTLKFAFYTGYITGLDMCKVCTEAVHSVALWTRVTLQVWTCVKYVPKQSIP